MVCCCAVIRRPILRISSLAIHLNREVNSKGFEINSQNHLPPMLASTLKLELNKPSSASAASSASASADAAAGAAAAAGKKPAAAPAPGFAQSMEERHPPRLLQLVAERLQCAPADIVDFDLQLCDTQPSALGGSEEEFIFSGRLDNLASCYTSLQALLGACSDASLADETSVRMARAAPQCRRRLPSTGTDWHMQRNDACTPCDFVRACACAPILSADRAL